ncbi:MAG: Flagellar biosynthesis protein FliQ, partial [uncultured Sphingosinicella sp.]
GRHRLFRWHRPAGALDPGARIGADPDPGAGHRHPARHGAGRDLDQRGDLELRAQADRGGRLPCLVRHRHPHAPGRLHDRDLRPDTRAYAM